MRLSLKHIYNDKNMKPESIELLKALRNPCISVGTRGHATNNLLKEFGGIGNSAVGCPSFYVRNMHVTREIDLERIGTNGRFANLIELSIHIAQGDDFGETFLIESVKGDEKIYVTEEIKIG